jgi:hypothetical protein
MVPALHKELGPENENFTKGQDFRRNKNSIL